MEQQHPFATSIPYAETRLLTLPEPSEWECLLTVESWRFIPNKGDEPNAFNRFMQRLCFGFRWRRRA